MTTARRSAWIPLTALLHAAGILHASAANAAAPAAATRNVVLEEIIVTAQKRQEVLQDVPQSITVLSNETFDRQHADNLQDYLALIPGLSMEGSTRGVSRISLRGINTGGVASTVGVYVDEVPFGSSSGLANGAILAGDFDTTDMARLEVLRGPQGTLYGASSLGGVMKFVTNPPQTESFEGNAQVGIEDVSGGDVSYSANGYVNIPLSDRFAVRATGFYRQDGGFVDSIGNNPIPSLTDPDVNIVQGSLDEDNINELQTYGGRFSALFNASDMLSVRLTALLQNIETDASDAIQTDRVTLKPLYGDRVASPYHHEPTDIEYRVYSATVDWDFGPASLMSSTSYGTFQEDLQRDQAMSFGGVATFLFGDPVTRPLSVILRQTTGTDKFTQELRLSSPDSETLEWLVGGYYTQEKSRIDPQDFFVVEAGTETIATDIPTFIEVFLRSEYEEYAGFANLTWHVTPRFDVTFGGRQSHNSQFADQLIDTTNLGGTRDARAASELLRGRLHLFGGAALRSQRQRSGLCTRGHGLSPGRTECSAREPAARHAADLRFGQLDELRGRPEEVAGSTMRCRSTLPPTSWIGRTCSCSRSSMTRVSMPTAALQRAKAWNSPR